MPYRYIYIGLGLVALSAIALAFALNPGGQSVEFPEPVEAVYPEPGDLVPYQVGIEIDLKVGYSAAIYVDGWLMQDPVFVEGTGVYRWEPTPANPTINEWSPGEHTIRVVYDTVNGLPDPGSFEWSFRVG